MKTINAIADQLFTANPQVEVYHFTSDMQAFAMEHNAYNHACTLKDKSVTDIWHPDITASEIKAKKQAAIAELQAGQNMAYRQTFPEIAGLISVNLNSNKLT